MTSKTPANGRPRRHLGGRARRYVRARVKRAGGALDLALHPRSALWVRGVGSAPGEDSSADARDLVRQLQEELRQERRQVLEPLLRRMTEYGRRLRRGERLPVEVLREGLDLWETYLNRIHNVHVGQFVAARASIPHTDACTLPLAQLEQEPDRSQARLRECRSMLAGYESRPALYSTLLALSLLGNSTAELSWEGFGEDFARSCLPDHLTPTALSQWNTAMVETRAEGERTRNLVASYLSKTKEYSSREGEEVAPET